MTELSIAFDKLVQDYGSITTLRIFKKEAILAWRRNFPLKKDSFQAFVKENISNIKQEHFEKTHGEHMKLIGHMWKKRKLDEKMTFDLDLADGNNLFEELLLE